MELIKNKMSENYSTPDDDPSKQPPLSSGNVSSDLNIEARAEQALGYLENGGLPPDQEEALMNAGFSDYVVGINQSGAHSGQDVMTMIERDRGIGIGGWDIGQHFLFYDKSYVQEWDAKSRARKDLERGYFNNPANYRFIVAFPIHPDIRTQRGVDTANHFTGDYKQGLHPSDFFIKTPQQENKAASRSVNPRYIAGYVDEHQKYRINPNFMK
jgi:hypothetical protein